MDDYVYVPAMHNHRLEIWSQLKLYGCIELVIPCQNVKNIGLIRDEMVGKFSSFDCPIYCISADAMKACTTAECDVHRTLGSVSMTLDHWSSSILKNFESDC